MLARVKWQGDRSYRTPDGNMRWHWDYGTLLQIVHTNVETYCFIAADGHDHNTRGKIIRKSTDTVRVTTWFKWERNEND